MEPVCAARSALYAGECGKVGGASDARQTSQGSLTLAQRLVGLLAESVAHLEQW